MTEKQVDQGADTAAEAQTIVDDASKRSVDPPAADGTGGPETATDEQKTADAAKGDGDKKAAPKSLADGADDPADSVPKHWPEDWRERLAGKDKTALKTLSRYQSPEGLWHKVKNLEKALNERSTPKKPGEDATEDEIAEYRRAVGLAESPEALLENLKLPDGRDLGDDDKPLAESFAKAMWEDSTPEQVSRALGWYYDTLEDRTAEVLEADENYQVEARKDLKEEWGAEFKRNINHLGTLFADAPEGMFDYMMQARGPDGRKLGDNPDMIKFFVAKAFEFNPQATVTTSEGTSTVSDRLKEIHGWRDSPDPTLQNKYWSAEVQAEELDLINKNLEIQKRTRRAA